MKGAFRLIAHPRTGCIVSLLALVLTVWPGGGGAWADELSEIAFTEGLMALKADDLPRAAERLETAVSRDRRDAPAWYWLGITRARAGDDEAAMHTLNKLPKDSSVIRVRNRCFMSGRPRSYYRKFGLSRIALRDLALNGELPGVTKSSW